MCGIIGYTGSENALPRLIEGLYALEYRGYDSAGIAFFKDGALDCVKSKGRIDILKEKLDPSLFAPCGIGHTRWATHGEPSDANSHPHGTEKLYIVHNGIIENYAELKASLSVHGYSFVSETDTEVAAKLIDYHYSLTGDPVKALRAAADEFRGSYAIAAVFSDFENTVFALRQDNPMLVALSDEGNFIASDISAVLGYTRQYIRPEEGEIAVVKPQSVTLLDRDGNEIKREVETALWNKGEAEKGGYPFFMIKEINEEPDVLVRTLRPRIKDGLPHFDCELLSEENIRKYENIHIVACGTAYHAGLIAKFAIEQLARIRVNVELASEFRYNDPILTEHDLVIVISQSGETADTLAALRLAKENGVPTLGIVNVAGSAIAREADSVVYTWAGPEIAVASTKAYSVQVALLELIAVHMAYASERLEKASVLRLTEELISSVPKAVAKVIEKADEFCDIAKKYKDEKNIFFIGRGIDHALCAEAALKCKEISYIHCEAYAAGELKHGTISLVTEGTPVFASANCEAVLEKTVSNIREVKSRGADVVLLTREGLSFPSDIADHIFALPSVYELFQPIVTVAAAQLMAYYLSYHLGIDVDKPRNLAKSVTVE